MMSSDSNSSSSSGFKYYHYDPSVAAAIIFAVLFSALAIRHLQLLIRDRTWCFIPFLLGCLFETVGYAARGYSAKQTPDWTLMPYIVQSMLILLGPTLFAASIYMVLGRLVRNLDGQAYSLIPIRWLTKVFVLGDVLSILGQGGGGGILASAQSSSSQTLGNNVILFGLGVQIVFFSCFMLVTAAFHVRILSRPTPKSKTCGTPWRRFIWVLYFVSMLIMVRSIFRMVEYGQGQDGALLQKEVYSYILDALLMTVAAVTFTVCHPGAVLAQRRALTSGIEFVGASDGYSMMKGSGYHNRLGPFVSDDA